VRGDASHQASPGRGKTVGFVEAIYVAPSAGEGMERLGEAMALGGCGLVGDRYCEGTGHWSRFGRVCQVTLISVEDLEAIEDDAGVRVKDGEHRRNLVTRGVDLRDLRRKRIRIGAATLEHVGPRSVCRYIERITEPGMTNALKGRGGVCATVIEGGRIRAGDEVVAL
jgi:MOSC domain-containing protein YiiM